jgi:hypothetical protein
VPGFVYVKDVRVMTGVLRPLDDTRWEVVCKVNGELYKRLYQNPNRAR